MQSELLEKYRSSLPKSCRNSYTAIARRFLQHSNGSLTRNAVEKYVEQLRNEGYSDGTLNFTFRVIRRLFIVNGVEWPFRRGEAPVVREREVYAPALSPDVIEAMILAARSGVLNEQETAMLALSTTYGLRRGEMASLSQESINLVDRLIFVETAKHGRQRYHLIPEEIVPYISAYRFRPYTPQKITIIYYDIEKKLGLSRMQEVGWHAIRRTLDMLLVEAGLPEITIMDFLRWKRSDRSMVARYYSVTLVGREQKVEMDMGDRRIDETVFAVHPFLPAWRGEDGQAEAE